MQTLNVIKVGGKVVEEDASLERLLSCFAAISGPKILVHGGGRTATRIASQLGVPTNMVDGRRVTDAPMLDVVTMVYGGLVNKRVVARLQAQGISAIGLTGADIDIIRSHKRPLVKGSDGALIDYGYVGDVDKVDSDALDMLIRGGYVPILAPLTHDGEGNMLNTNADTIASSVAKALSGKYEVILRYCFEKAGVLSDPEDESSVISRIDKSLFGKLKENGTIAGGMIPKLENAFDALGGGVKEVRITASDALDQGTVICMDF